MKRIFDFTLNKFNNQFTVFQSYVCLTFGIPVPESTLSQKLVREGKFKKILDSSHSDSRQLKKYN